jgi:hypothetical protein
VGEAELPELFWLFQELVAGERLKMKIETAGRGAEGTGQLLVKCYRVRDGGVC